MDFNTIKQITQQEETQTLITTTINDNDNEDKFDYYGSGVATVKVVEYMLSSMSNELLRKFPDNSAFDFDYTQSSIWSPLVPHPSKPSSPLPELKQRKISFDEEEDVEEEIHRKLDSGLFNCFKIRREFGENKVVGMKLRRSRNRGFGELRSNSKNLGNVAVDRAGFSPIRNKGWKKVLKAASKQFKKTMKKKDSGAHLKLSSNGFSRISC